MFSADIFIFTSLISEMSQCGLGKLLLIHVVYVSSKLPGRCKFYKPVSVLENPFPYFSGTKTESFRRAYAYCFFKANFQDGLRKIRKNCYIYTVSTKKLHPCIRCHNSGKQRRILKKFYANSETLICKQVTKFQQNRSTSATATASLVRSLKSISVHYRHRRDWLSSVRSCEWQDVSTPKVCVQNVHRVLERKLEDMVATAWHRWPLFDQVRLQLVDVKNLAAVHTILQLPPNLVVDRVKVRTVSWPQSWSDEIWCFMS